MSRVEMPQRSSSLASHYGVLSCWSEAWEARAVKRREFITLLGSAAAWPLAARAQQLTLPLVGFLSGRSPSESAYALAAFHEGLKQGDTSRDKTSRSNIAGPRVNTIDCRRSSATCFGIKSASSLRLEASGPRWQLKRQQRQFR